MHSSDGEDPKTGAGMDKPVAATDPAAAMPVFKNDLLDILWTIGGISLLRISMVFVAYAFGINQVWSWGKAGNRYLKDRD